MRNLLLGQAVRMDEWMDGQINGHTEQLVESPIFITENYA